MVKSAWGRTKAGLPVAAVVLLLFAWLGPEHPVTILVLGAAGSLLAWAIVTRFLRPSLDWVQETQPPAVLRQSLSPTGLRYRYRRAVENRSWSRTAVDVVVMMRIRIWFEGDDGATSFEVPDLSTTPRLPPRDPGLAWIRKRLGQRKRLKLVVSSIRSRKRVKHLASWIRSHEWMRRRASAIRSKLWKTGPHHTAQFDLQRMSEQDLLLLPESIREEINGKNGRGDLKKILATAGTDGINKVRIELYIRGTDEYSGAESRAESTFRRIREPCQITEEAEPD